MSVQKVLITLFDRPLILRVTKDVYGLDNDCWLDGGDQPDLQHLGFTPHERRLTSGRRLDKPGITYDPRVNGWAWTFTHWSRRVADPDELTAARVWTNATWNKAFIDRVWWHDFTHGGTLVRASFSGTLATPTAVAAWHHCRDGRIDQWRLACAAAEKEFLEFRRRYDPDNIPHRDDQCTILIPVAEIEKVLAPVPVDVFELIRGSSPEG